MSKNIVFQGWLTKSPPTKRVWRTRWHRRWFALRQSGELPGQYFLDYYTDRSCRRLKGTINLDLCEQVDAGLHMERSGTGAPDPSIRGSVFRIQTQSRIYHLEADCQADMEKWVDAICRVCGLRAIEENCNATATYQNTTSPAGAEDQEPVSPGLNPDVYIPISECITGVKSQDSESLFTFDTNSIVMSERRKMYTSQPHMGSHAQDFSDNDSHPSDEECKSWNCSQGNIRDWPATKAFAKLAISPNLTSETVEGPPVPPRPPKTLSSSIDAPSTDLNVPEKIEDSVNDDVIEVLPLSRPQRRYSNTLSVGRLQLSLAPRVEEEECSPGVVMQYYNLPSLPPAVDRALKPRPTSHSISDEPLSDTTIDKLTSAMLQYSDLDLPAYSPSKSTLAASQARRLAQGKSFVIVKKESPYKEVDFVKTEAFNMTRQDAEAFRNTQN